jgi:hypothetical protein
MCLCVAAGGGTALLYASKGLVDGFKERGQLANFDQQVPPLPCCRRTSCPQAVGAAVLHPARVQRGMFSEAISRCRKPTKACERSKRGLVLPGAEP